MENKQNVPQVRFKGFTDAWEQRELGEIATEMIAGGDVDKSLLCEDGNCPVIANALTNDGIIGYYKNEYRVKAPAVTVTGRGDVGHAKARNDDFTPVVRLLSVKSEHDIYFLENAINAIKIVVESTGVPQLTVPQLSKNVVFYPNSAEEEKKIGTYFRNLDTLITLHQRKCDSLQKLKKSMLQKMFPKSGSKYPEIRFKGFTDAWEQRELGEIATEMIAGGDVDKSLLCEDGNCPVIANALTNDGIIGYYKNEYRVKAPAVTVTGRGDVGHAKARNDDFTPVVRLLSVKSEHDIYFLENAINAIKIVVESTGVPQLTVPQLSKNVVFYPNSAEEEKKIGTYFRNLDTLITLHQRKLETLKKLKKSMLQKMFI